MKADQLSQTAAFVAVKFYGLTQIPEFRSLFDNFVIDFYDRLVKTLPAPIRYYHYWLQYGWVRRCYIWSEELMLPGDLLHIIARKWHIQQMVHQLVDENYEQLIILGAGFDHLGCYYAQKGLPCFEFDAPLMAKRKQQFLDTHYHNHPQPHIITSHFPDDEIGQLFCEQEDVDPHKKTIVVAEGFFDYLHSKTVSSSLHQIQEYFSHNPALVTTHFALGELPAFHQWVFKSSVTLVGEALQFDTSMNDFHQLVETEGFKVNELIGNKEIASALPSHLDSNLDILKGFYILRAV